MTITDGKLLGEGIIVVDDVTVSLLNASEITAPDDAAWQALAFAAQQAAQYGGLFATKASTTIHTADGRAWHASVPSWVSSARRVMVSRDLPAAIRATGQQTPVTPESGDGLLGNPANPVIWDPTRHADHD